MPAAVSVIIPTFNRAHLIRRAVDSVLRQGLPAEVIVVDDGSQDATADVLEAYGDRIRVLRQENRGVSAARNRGVAAASGDWIAFLDSDDEWLPHKLERQLELVREYPDVVLFSGAAEYVDEGGSVRNIGSASHRGSIVDVLLYENVIVTSTVLVRRSALEELGTLFEARLSPCEDWGVWLRIAARHPILVTREILVRYHITADGLTRASELDRYRRICKTLYENPGDAVLADAIRRQRRSLEANVHFLSACVAYDSGHGWRARRELLRALTISPRRLKASTALRIAFVPHRAADMLRIAMLFLPRRAARPPAGKSV
jgi:glycosyltransferase involved in cell wall biosynthesis